MAVKTEPPINLTIFSMRYVELLISTASAAKIMELLADARTIDSNYSDTNVTIKQQASFTMESISAERVLNITKAQMLGKSLEDYLEDLEEARNATE